MTRNNSAGPSPLRYQLPRPAGTVWLGLRFGTLLVLALGLAAAITLSLAGAPAPVAAALLATALVVALVPIADRPLLQWLAPATQHLARVAGRDWSAPSTDDPTEPASSPSPEGPLTTQKAGPAAPDRVRLVLPPECGRVHAVPLHDETSPHRAPVGTLVHSRTHTVLLEVQGAAGFGLLDADDQDTHLAGWGGCLDALAADAHVLRVQWLTHARPDNCVAPSTPRRGPVSDDPADDYEQLVRATTREAWTHTHLLAVTLRDPGRPSGARRKARLAAGTTDQTTYGPVLEQIRDVTSQLLTADLLARPLTLDELGTTLRLLTEPALSPDVLPTDPVDAVNPACQAWGIRCRRAGWDAVRTGDSWHRSYTISSWPSLPLPADWLAGLLTAAPPDGTSRTLSIHAKPVAPVHAARQARAAAAKAHLDASDRNRFRLASTPGGASAGDDQRAEDAAALEAELAAGYRMLQTRALVTVSATDPQRLTQAAAALRTTAATHRLDLRPLHGQHQHGLLATLPLGLLPGTRS
jgi:hypothetical protein